MLFDLEAQQFQRLQSPEGIRAHKRRAQRALAVRETVLPEPTLIQKIYGPLRRVVEWFVALAFLVLLSPVLLLAALGVKLTSPGPTFYTQVRVGRWGKPFTVFKLRTMVHNCESLTGPRWCIPGDPRVTWFGWILRRTHIDELPQLVNVLRGDMSLVGPRPERPEFVAELEQAIPGYLARHALLPGITGLAQVHLPPDTDINSVRRKLLFDMYYIRHHNPLLDLSLYICTLVSALGLPMAAACRLCFVPSAEQVENAGPLRFEEASSPANVAA
jgi:lipopolysaccharide/colanic/teichoic acid biosynthesis glycosyltransferase